MSKHVRIITDANFSTEVTQAKLPVLLDLWAPWCAPCVAFGPVIQEIADKYVGKLIVGKLDVEENPKTTRAFSIRSIPTLLVFQNGKVVHAIVGVVPQAEIEATILKTFAN